MADRYPGYDVLSKRRTPSWNEQTRRVVDERLAISPDHHSFLDHDAFALLRAICDRLVPQPADRARPVPVAALIDEKLVADRRDGYRSAHLPPLREAWRRGLSAIDAEALQRHGVRFVALDASRQDELLAAVQAGNVTATSWEDLSPVLFFRQRLLHDALSAYYSDPHGWNEIGFGGPASPRGYVRMNFDRRDPWEAAEAKPGREHEAFKENQRVGR